MELQVKQDRPPYIEFKRVPVEDRDASIEAGRTIYKDQDFVELTPIGSKDKLVKPVADWLSQSAQQVNEGRLPQTWMDAYRGAYKQWQDGQEIPIEGTPIRTWPVASPSEVENCVRIHIRSVEDLAAANEEAIMRLGMGGRALKQRAVDWLTAAKSSGKVTQEITALRAQNEALKTRNDALEARLAKLEAATVK